MPALLRTELATASRERLLRYLAAAIHGYTVMARDPGAGSEQRAGLNDRVHYLAGHLMALTNQEEPLTAGRLDGIMEHVAALNVRLADSIRIELNK